MILQDFFLPAVDWHVKVYYAVTRYFADEIIDELRYIGCSGKFMDDAIHQLRRGKLDSGITYSNASLRESVIVIELTSSGAEFNNSLQHEQRHLERHICNALHIDPDSEDAAYLAGDIAKAMFVRAKYLMCDCCRKKLPLSE